LFFIVLGDVGHCEPRNLTVYISVRFALQSNHSQITLVYAFVARTALRGGVDAEDGDYFDTVAGSDFVCQFSVDN